jgi:hypothetical protein
MSKNVESFKPDSVDLRKVNRHAALSVIPAKAGIHFKYLKAKAK